MRTALVLGGNGFIGSHMVKRLRDEGYWVRSVGRSSKNRCANASIKGDLTDPEVMRNALMRTGKCFDEIYVYAAEMGGIEFTFSGENDAVIMRNSNQIHTNLFNGLIYHRPTMGLETKIFFASTACIYPEQPNPVLKESDAYPANPNSDYGWEKLFAERFYLAHSRNLKIPVCIGRHHTVYGPGAHWTGGREKAVLALCRKVAMLPPEGGEIEVWGDGEQTRSFLYIDDAIEATRQLMRTYYSEPVNIGSDQLISINDTIDIIAKVSGKKVTKNHIDGIVGTRARSSDNTLLYAKTNYRPSVTLEDGIRNTYEWVESQVNPK